MRAEKLSDSITVEQMWQIFDHLIGGRPVIYYSTPISTGKRYLAWWESTGHKLQCNELATERHKAEYNKSLLANVVQPNRAAALALMATINYTNAVHLSPAAIDFTAWSHHEFMRFWQRFFTKQIISEVICLPDWEYSLGCVLEYKYAIDNKLSVRGWDCHINLDALLVKMLGNIRHMTSIGINCEDYIEVYQLLQMAPTTVMA